MRFSDHDPNQVNATFVPDAPGLWTFRVDAWSDPMATWRNSVTKKIEAGQSEAELANDLEIGARLFDRAAAGAATVYRSHLRGVAQSLRSDSELRARVSSALSDETRGILELPLRELLTRSKTRKVLVERREACSARGTSSSPLNGGFDDDGNLLHGTFLLPQLDRAAHWDSTSTCPRSAIGDQPQGPQQHPDRGTNDVGSRGPSARRRRHDAIEPRSAAKTSSPSSSRRPRNAA